MPDVIMAHIFHSAYTERALNSIGSGHRVILIDNSYSGEMGVYARRNPHIEYVKPKVPRKMEGSFLAWNPLSCAESWNLAISKVETEWFVNVNPDTVVAPQAFKLISLCIDGLHDPDIVLFRTQVNFNVWWGNTAWLREHPFDTRYRPCGAEDEDMLCQIATAGKKWSKAQVPVWHQDGGHLNRIDGYCNTEPFRQKWGWKPHSPEFNALVGGAV